jgi:rhamnosyltransferase
VSLPPLASVVLPVRDAGPRLAEVLQALAEQELDGGLEVVALDSGSRDGSRDRLVAAGAQVIDVAPSAFDHGETRNAGVRAARGEFVLFLSHDAVPRGPRYAARLVAALAADPRLAGVFARQEPRPDADALTRRDLRHWVAAGEAPRTVFLSRTAFEGLPPLERHRLCAFDNVASAVRRSILLEFPFASSRFGEDLEWGRRALQEGFGLAFVPEAVVEHSHPRSARALFRRNYLGHRLLRRLFGVCTIPDAPHLVRAAAGAVASDLGELWRAGGSPDQWLAAPAQSVASVLGQYRGARDEGKGRAYPAWA